MKLAVEATVPTKVKQLLEIDMSLIRSFSNSTS